MNDKTGCEAFQDRLDRLGGNPPGELEIRELNQHTADCPDCAMMLEAYLHLAGPSNNELEAAVPDEMVDSMWMDVSSRAYDRGLTSGSKRFSFLRVLVPVLAAAVVILVFALGFMLGELRHLRGIEDRMAAEIESRDETIAALHVRSDETTGLLTSDRFRNLVRRRYLQDRETYRVSELIAILEQMPPDTKILSAQEVNALIGGGSGSSYSPYYSRIQQIDYSNGLDAREAILLIDALGIDSSELIPREQIATLRGI